MPRNQNKTIDKLFELLDQLGAENTTTLTSVRLPTKLRDALKLGVELGMDESITTAAVQAAHLRLEAFAQRLALESHYERHPNLRPTLARLAQVAAELDDNPIAHQPSLVKRAASEVVSLKPDADADDVLIYAAGLRSAARQAS